MTLCFNSIQLGLIRSNLLSVFTSPKRVVVVQATCYDPDGKEVEFASDREKWYAARCHALLEVKRYQECIDLGESALKSFPRFHHDNDLWLRYRMAHAKAQLRDLDNALQDLLLISTRKKDWFIQKDIAEILRRLGKPEEALRYAAAGALGSGDLEYKWELCFLLGKLLMETKPGQPEIVRHILLAAKLRQEHGWKIPSDLGAAMRDYKVDLGKAPDAPNIVRELKGFWISLQFAGRTPLQGKIKNLMPGGKSGFIIDEKGMEYHFVAREFRGKLSQIESGLPVQFYIEKNVEPGKKDHAVFIQELK